jgi:hypothetical protein
VSNDAANKPTRGEWFNQVVRILTGERVSEHQLQERALANLITPDNAGVVPDAFSQELIGVIDAQRPFMATTRRMDTPTSGMGLILPRIVTRPTVATQATEKAELSSTATAIDTVTYNAETLGGAGDISIQLLKRSSPEFLGPVPRASRRGHVAVRRRPRRRCPARVVADGRRRHRSRQPLARRGVDELQQLAPPARHDLDVQRSRRGVHRRQGHDDEHAAVLDAPSRTSRRAAGSAGRSAGFARSTRRRSTTRP